MGKIGIVQYAWVCVYVPVNSSNGRGREEMRKFWNDVNECLRSFERGSRMVLMDDMNERVGRNEIAGVVRKWDVDGINENGKHLVDVCAERGLSLGNTFFQHRLVHRYTWIRMDERDEQKSLTDYIAVDEKIKKDVLDARVMRGLFDGSDHSTVVAKIQIRGRWEYSKKCEIKGREVITSERLDRNEVREEFEKKVCEKFGEARMTVGEETSVNDVFNVFKEVMTVAQKVVGHRICKCRAKGSAWWAEEIKGAVEEKKKAYKRMLQRNTSEVNVRRRNEYRAWKKKVKELVDESKTRVDQEFGRKLSEKFMDNRKLFWKEVEREEM